MSRLIRDLATGTPEMLAAFGDDTLIRHALAFEAALARACADVGLIDARAAEAIASACATLTPGPEALAHEAARAGTLAIPLVALLRQSLADAQIAAAVHKGATSQDVADTALVLQIATAQSLVMRDLNRVIAAVRALAAKHAQTVMIGRTLLQQALPITFGLKCAHWLMSLHDDRARYRQACDAALALQLGGAVGTREAFDGRGEAIAKHMAAALGLSYTPLPWHTRRGNLIALGTAVALIVATLGKIAQDIALMAQGEVGEVAEPAIPGRGGSSTMSHKRNPTGCQVVLSAASRTPGLVASLLAGAANEHERGLGGWQAEAPVIADLFAITHGALVNLAGVVEGLEVHADAMRHNLERAGVGRETGEAEAMVSRALEITKEGT